MTRLWEKVLKKINTRIDKSAYDYFFADTYIYQQRGNSLVVAVPNLVVKNTIENNYSDDVLEILSELEEQNFEVTYVTAEEIKASKEEEKVVSKPSKSEPEFFKNAFLKPEFTFDNFVVGDFNKEAQQAALYVAKNGGTLFNPLFIYSRSGLGKTHLLYAIGNYVKENRIKDAKILYMSAQDFVDEYVSYVRGEQESKSLKAFFYDVDLLLFDDVQILAEKVKTEEMFFAIYQNLINAGKRIILTSDKQPVDLKGLEERLVTRFKQGLTVKIGEPDVDTCVEILKQKCINSGFKPEKIDANVLYFVAENYSKDLRELDGAFNQLVFLALKSPEDKTITIDEAIKVLATLKSGKKVSTQLNEQKILNVVADYYKLTPSQLTGKDRFGQIVLARHIAMYLIRNNLDVPLKKIGQLFGGKDHTTVMSAITKVDKELKTDKQLQDAIAELEKRIKK